MSRLPKLLAAVAATALVSSSAYADSATVRSVRNPAPLVSFDIHSAGPDGSLTSPPKTLPQTSVLDKNGVYATLIDGKEYRHISTIASQASNMQASDLDLEKELSRNPKTLESSKKALDWLEGNSIKLPKDAITWHYTFDHTFNTLFIKGGWPSAFAQADVIKAFILAHRKTGEPRYRELALRAAYAFTVPCEEGGLRCEVGGVPWFEEIPVPYGYAPMILNGHLFAVVMLHRLWQETGDSRVKAAFDEGLASSRKLLLRYDTGYWSQYQMRPRALNALLVIAPTVEDTQISKVSISSAFTAESSLSLRPASKTYPGNATWPGDGASKKNAPKAGNLTFVQLLPGMFAIDHDPVNFRGFDVDLRYSSPGCAPIRVGTYDWRAPSSNWMALPNVRFENKGNECIARTVIPNSLTQFSQIDVFYHTWHTRLVTELWRISGDAKFYTTAIRWNQYLAQKQAQDKLNPDGEFFEPFFNVADSAEDDELLKLALQGREPAELTEDEIRRRLDGLVGSHNLSSERVAALLNRVGLRQGEQRN